MIMESLTWPKRLLIINDTTDPYNAYYKDDHLYYINRAQNYVNMFNPNLGFFNGRTSTVPGDQLPENFHPENGAGIIRKPMLGIWLSMHRKMGKDWRIYTGEEKACRAKLDQFFSTPETAKYVGGYGGIIHEMREARDVRMGQYGHSNQPSHHIPYMYIILGSLGKHRRKCVKY